MEILILNIFIWIRKFIFQLWKNFIKILSFDSNQKFKFQIIILDSQN